jgi:hypothetical protein
LPFPAFPERISFLRDAQMKLSESKDDIFYRFDQPNGFWYELAYVKARKPFSPFAATHLRKIQTGRRWMPPRCGRLNKMCLLG